MQLPSLLALALTACTGGDQYIVEGTVVEVHPPDEVVLDHAPIAGLMDAMVMPFDVADPSMLAGLEPGVRVVARYQVSESGSALVKLRITGRGPAPVAATGPVPLRVGDRIATTRLGAHDGSEVLLGEGQTERIALTFVYTRCPKPEFCPAMIGRLQALQAALDQHSAGAGAGAGEGARLVAVTLDPEYDTTSVLAEYAAQVGAGPRWLFARAPEGGLDDLAMRAGLPVLRGAAEAPDEIAHGLRLLVLDRGGALLERYDDARFPLDRVVAQLTTGEPKGDPQLSGTVTPAPE